MSEISGLVDGLFRRESGRLVSALTRAFGPSRIDLAEDVVQETLMKALRVWPHHGVPDNPAAWLQRAARNLAIDRLRSENAHNRAAEAVATTTDRAGPEQNGRFEELVRFDRLADDQLRLIFVCCHPALSPESRVALTLKLLCGFSVEEIARGLREKQATIAQRIVRAKQAIRQRGLSLETPPDDLGDRLNALLHVLYLLFNEGYSATCGPNLVRDHLCHEAIRLGEIVADHPGLHCPEADALLALFCFQAARLPARVDGAGDMLLLVDQDRAKWDSRLIRRGIARLQRSQRGDSLTRYHIEAGIASIHAGAASCEETDWHAVSSLYDILLEMTQSPIVALNRAVVIGKAESPEAALSALEPLRSHPDLESYHLLYAVIGDLEFARGRYDESALAYSNALRCKCTAPERRLLAGRLAAAREADSRKPSSPPAASFTDESGNEATIFYRQNEQSGTKLARCILRGVSCSEEAP